MVAEAGGQWAEVIAECRPVAAHFVQHQLTDATADGEVSAAEEASIQRTLELFGLDDLRSQVGATIQRVRLLADLRSHQLPAPFRANPAWAQSGEAVYLRQPAQLDTTGRIPSHGELWLTSTRVEYVASSAGASLPLKSIREAVGRGSRLRLTDSKKTRVFTVPDAQVMAAFVVCLMQANHRTATVQQASDTRQDRRRISKEVRNAVWIRDGGACVECGAQDYLEYDHLIPVAKGGGNTVGNIQLLCRGCNGRKGDRI